MNKILIRCLLTLLCLMFQMTPLFGMSAQYGTIYQEKKTVLTNIVNNSFQVNVRDGSEFLDNAFRAFNQVKQISSERVNLLFHNGSLYINRFFPIHQAYEGIEISNKKYFSLQVASLLRLNKNQIIALQMAKENIGIMRTAAASSDDYYSIAQAWNEIRARNDNDKKIIIHQKINSCQQRKLIPFYRSLYNFAYAASILEYNIADKNFNVEALNEIYSHAQACCTDYANRIMKYISFFDEASGNAFMQSLQNGDILLNIKNACIRYGQYAHTEYMVDYYLSSANQSIEEVLFVSFYDMCLNCEKHWATIANMGILTYVASYINYYNSRDINRKSNNTRNLVLVYK